MVERWELSNDVGQAERTSVAWEPESIRRPLELTYSSDGEHLFVSGKSAETPMGRVVVLEAFDSNNMHSRGQWKNLAYNFAYRSGGEIVSLDASKNICIAAINDSSVRLFELDPSSELQCLATYKTAEVPTGAVLADNGRRALVSLRDGRWIGLEIQIGRKTSDAMLSPFEVLDAPTDEAATTLALCQGSNFLATGSADDCVRMWHYTNKRLTQLFSIGQFGSPIKSVEFHPDGQKLLVVTQRSSAVHILHLNQLRESFRKLHPDWQDRRQNRYRTAVVHAASAKYL